MQSCRKVLEKFKIAQLEDDAVVTTYEQQGKDDLFYTELKHSMITYFQENKVRHTTSLTSVTFCPKLSKLSAQKHIVLE
jgi:hypothetical protein